MNLYIFTNDLRLSDNSLLAQAQNKNTTICIYIFKKENYFVNECLNELEESFLLNKSYIFKFIGNDIVVLGKICDAVPIQVIYINETTSELEEFCMKLGILIVCGNKPHRNIININHNKNDPTYKIMQYISTNDFSFFNSLKYRGGNSNVLYILQDILNGKNLFMQLLPYIKYGCITYDDLEKTSFNLKEFAKCCRAFIEESKNVIIDSNNADITDLLTYSTNNGKVNLYMKKLHEQYYLSECGQLTVRKFVNDNNLDRGKIHDYLMENAINYTIMSKCLWCDDEKLINKFIKLFVIKYKDNA